MRFPVPVEHAVRPRARYRPGATAFVRQCVQGWLVLLFGLAMGFGLLGNIVVGIVGAFIAAWLLPRIGIVIGGGMVASIINATIGAVILLVIIGLIKRA